MKNRSVKSLPISVTATLKTVNDRVSAIRSPHLLSRAGKGIPAVLENLRPRFFEGLAAPELKSILAAAEYRRLPANSVITHQDQPAKHLFLLLTGRARYFFVTEKGQKVILLWVPAGEIFGMAAFHSPPIAYLSSTETARNSSMLVWDRDTIRSFAARQPRLFENALDIGVHFMTAYHAAHRALICGSARERFAHVLATLAGGFGHKVAGGVELDVKNEELANEANVTLFTASRLISEWQRGGMLRKSRGKILLRSPERLLRYEA
jgi:CRP-like cAMP-binding protein